MLSVWFELSLCFVFVCLSVAIDFGVLLNYFSDDWTSFCADVPCI